MWGNGSSSHQLLILLTLQNPLIQNHLGEPGGGGAGVPSVSPLHLQDWESLVCKIMFLQTRSSHFFLQNLFKICYFHIHPVCSLHLDRRPLFRTNFLCSGSFIQHLYSKPIFVYIMELTVPQKTGKNWQNSSHSKYVLGWWKYSKREIW